MSREDEIAAAQLAGLIGGELRSIDSKMVARSSTDSVNRLDPRDFLSKPPQRPNAQTTNMNFLPKGSIIEAPKSRPAGSEVVGVENVDIGSLMIPMDGADKKMRDAIKAYSEPNSMKPPQLPKQPMIVGNITPIENTRIMLHEQPSEIITLLKEMNGKLDLLLKRAKIQPRYKK